MHLLVFVYVLIACCIFGLSLNDNLAYNKECKQSTLGNPNMPSSKYCYHANDGNMTVCSRTQFNDGLVKWWLVDLNMTVQVLSVVITNSQFPSRLRDFTIKTYHLDPTMFYPFGSMCYQHVGVFPSDTTTVNCTTAPSGRYLEIAKLDVNTSPLELCEVEVYGLDISTQVTGEGYCENKESRMDANNMTMDTSTSIECARKCNHEPRCLAFNYQHDPIKNCILLTETGPINYSFGVSYWKKCAQN